MENVISILSRFVAVAGSSSESAAAEAKFGAISVTTKIIGRRVGLK